jgi:hypothetical protein
MLLFFYISFHNSTYQITKLPAATMKLIQNQMALHRVLVVSCALCTVSLVLLSHQCAADIFIDESTVYTVSELWTVVEDTNPAIMVANNPTANDRDIFSRCYQNFASGTSRKLEVKSNSGGGVKVRIVTFNGCADCGCALSSNWLTPLYNERLFITVAGHNLVMSKME